LPGRETREVGLVDIAEAAGIQTLLEGVALPARKRELLVYAARQRPQARQLEALRGLPEREYVTIDEVGEELVRVQPPERREVLHQPREESGAPPGGVAYTRGHFESGRV
jgi:hypothetical protein